MTVLASNLVNKYLSKRTRVPVLQQLLSHKGVCWSGNEAPRTLNHGTGAGGWSVLSLPDLLPGLDPPGRFQSQSGRGAGDRNLPLQVGVEPRFPIHPARSLATIVADVSLFRRVL